MEPTVFFFHVRNRIGSWLEHEGYVNALHPSEIEQNRLFATDYTVAYFYDAETNSIVASRSVRHPHDRFVKATGRQIASDRLTGKTPHEYHPYFDAVLPVEDILEIHGYSLLLDAFKPESREKIAELVLGLASDFDNLSGSVVVQALETHFDTMSSRHGPRMGLGGGTAKLPIEFVPGLAEEIAQ